MNRVDRLDSFVRIRGARENKLKDGSPRVSMTHRRIVDTIGRACESLLERIDQ